jgi:hypothetical protein
LPCCATRIRGVSGRRGWSSARAVAFRALVAQQRPDHATIARFIEAIAGLFGEVLTLCARQGLAKVGVIAVDGTKVPANASRDANRDYEQLAREILEKAKAVDAAEDELYGETYAAMSCPSSCAPARAGARGCARPSAASKSSAPRTHGRFPATGPSGSRKPSAASTRNCGPRFAPTRPTSATGRGA